MLSTAAERRKLYGKNKNNVYSTDRDGVKPAGGAVYTGNALGRDEHN